MIHFIQYNAGRDDLFPRRRNAKCVADMYRYYIISIWFGSKVYFVGTFFLELTKNMNLAALNCPTFEQLFFSAPCITRSLFHNFAV